MMGVESAQRVRTEVRRDMSESEDDISVGCPTPRPSKCEMSDSEDKPRTGVRSFSILDILGHKEQKEDEVTSVKPSITLRQDLLQRSTHPSQAKIVRPWDLPQQAAAYQSMLQQQQMLRHQMPFMHPFAAAALAGLMPFQMPQMPHPSTMTSHPPRLPAWSPASSREEQEEMEDSSSNASTSPALSGEKPKVQPDSKAKIGKDGSPLDALFQMTSKTFEGNGVDPSGSGSHGSMFGNRQSSNKKKRKSRTAFTNHQIFELEKRFLYQKYLSPADRDEIALSLGLTNAQVITWFQNRRAKLKRDMEELKKDVESAKIISAHSAVLMHATALQHEVAMLQHQKQVFDDPKKL